MIVHQEVYSEGEDEIDRMETGTAFMIKSIELYTNIEKSLCKTINFTE